MKQALMQLAGVTLQRGERLLCRELELQLAEGECWGVLGPNGAGKSTLLQAMAGLLPPAAGTVYFQGRPLPRWPRKALARELGMLFQLDEENLATTVFETVLGGRHPHLGTFGWETALDLVLAKEAMQTVALEPLAERDPGTLSGGERQRMEIAVLLAQSPRLALVDEPTNHLDPGQQVQMLHLLKTRFTTDGRALVMVLHDINLALAFCDRLLLIRGDGDWRAGPASETGTPETLSWLYDHPVRQAENCLSFL